MEELIANEHDLETLTEEARLLALKEALHQKEELVEKLNQASLAREAALIVYGRLLQQKERRLQRKEELQDEWLALKIRDCSLEWPLIHEISVFDSENRDSPPNCSPSRQQPSKAKPFDGVFTENSGRILYAVFLYIYIGWMLSTSVPIDMCNIIVLTSAVLFFSMSILELNTLLDAGENRE